MSILEESMKGNKKISLCKIDLTLYKPYRVTEYKIDEKGYHWTLSSKAFFTRRIAKKYYKKKKRRKNDLI